MRLIILFEDGTWQTWGIEKDSDVEYWVHRRIEKEGRIAAEVYVVTQENERDAASMVNRYWEKRARYDEEQQEIEERAAYARLKAKFEKPKETT
jgi:hypothetical protein